METRQNTTTLEARKELQARVDEFTSIATFGRREIIYFGTYHHEESLYIAESEKGVNFRTWPIITPHPQDKVLNLAPLIQEKIDAGELTASSKAALYDGSPVFPHRHDREYIANGKARGRTYFAMQQMLVMDLADEDRYPLRLRDLIVFDTAEDRAPIAIAWGMNNDQGRGTAIEEIKSLGFGTDCFHRQIFFDSQWAPFRGTKMWVDPSGRGKDLTAICVISHLNGYLYVRHIAGFKGGFDTDTLEQIVMAAKQYRCGNITIEDNFGQGMLEPLIMPVLRRQFMKPGDDPAYPDGWGCSVETQRAVGQKEIRIIERLEPVMGRHRLVFATSVAENTRLQRQITRVTRQRNCLENDDEIDCLAGCVSLWQHVLSRDPAKAAENNRGQAAKDYLVQRAKWCRMKVPKPRWFQHQ